MFGSLVEVFPLSLSWFLFLSLSLYGRVVYLLQMHPMDISARLLSPILTAQTWVSRTFHPQQKPGASGAVLGLCDLGGDLQPPSLHHCKVWEKVQKDWMLVFRYTRFLGFQKQNKIRFDSYRRSKLWNK